MGSQLQRRREPPEVSEAIYRRSVTVAIMIGLTMALLGITLRGVH